MARNPLLKIFTVIAIFVIAVIIMFIAITGISNQDKYDITNTSDTQDAQYQQETDQEQLQQPVFKILTGLVLPGILGLAFLLLLAYLIRIFFKTRKG